MEFLSDPAIWISLLTLVVIEIILGIDNLVFIAILATAAPARPRAPDRPRARTDHGGGLFLVFKGTMELHERLEGTIARAQPEPRLCGLLAGGVADRRHRRRFLARLGDHRRGHGR